MSLTNSGGTSATISQATVIGTGVSISGLGLPLTLTPGQSTSFTASFAPTTAGTTTGSIAITSTATNPSLRIPFSGVGATTGALVASPDSIAFGSVLVGGAQSHSETLSNTGGSTVHISGATVTGAGFSVSGISVPTTLNAGQSLTFNVNFSPQSSGASSGGLAFAADGSVPNLSVAVSGTDTPQGQLTVTPATANFGNVTVGVTQTLAASLSGSGGAVTVSAATSSNPEFAVARLSLPLNLTAGQSAAFTLTFTPQASGAASGTISFTTNTTNVPNNVALTGTGMPAPQHSVTLSWTASTSTVIGYNVYRGTQSGGPYAILNNTPDPSTSYTDSLVQAGQTYYFVVTAVDATGT